MKKFLIIAVLSGFSSSTVHSQLLEDTDRKLKNAKVEGRGFLFFRNKKKIKNSGGIPSAKNKSSPRYSGPDERRVRKYSVGVSSSGGVFKFKSITSSPRYSPGIPFIKNSYKISPKYSSGGNPFRGSSYKIATRYSPENPFSGSKYHISPRYSDASPKFRNSRFVYSHAPIRYSQGIPFRGKDYNIKPRYSKGMPFRETAYNSSPRYTGTKLSFFKMVGNGELAIARHYQKSSLWKGNAESLRLPIALRPWSKFRSKINGDPPRTRGVKDPGGKAKFDKKERVIWNN
ncbi:MAG: hypothetical protein GDA51_02745 [Ekhidna sp.]|nr:hypothetical protein [Ekhidna sp.]MBC6425391.1 hypothetical protein [Ekhidna sp.]